MAHLLCIREVLPSNFLPEAGYPDTGASCFSSVPPGKWKDNSLKYATTVPFPI